MEDYTGLAATAWELFSGDEPGADYPFFREALERNPGPALDVGCGTGRLLLPLLEEGFEVEGVDPSADMLAICRRRAERRGLAPVLYRQAMQRLDLPRRYRVIFIPCGSFQLVVDREEAFEALRRLHTHLEADGLLLLTLYNRWKELEDEVVGEWRFRAREPLPDGSELLKEAMLTGRNLIEQTLAATVRYRRFQQDRLLEEQISSSPERWYFKHEMMLMLEKAGFRPGQVTGNYTDAEAGEEDYVLAFFAMK